MQLLLLLVASLTVAGIFVMIANLRSAPLGFEDERGFHILSSNDDDGDTWRRAARRRLVREAAQEPLDDTAPHAA